MLTEARQIMEINQPGWVSGIGSYCNLKHVGPSYEREKGNNHVLAKLLTALWNYVLNFF